MKTISADAHNILSLAQPNLAALLKEWRQRLGYFSIFAALPVMVSTQAKEARADDAIGPHTPLARPKGNLRAKLKSGRASTAFLRGQSEYRLPHQRGSFDMVSVFTGNDDCPGQAIPPGTYAAAAPYTDTGNTTGANNTVNQLGYFGYYYYYSHPVNGPDLVYTFTVISRGASPEIRVTPTSSTYDPSIYIVDGRSQPRCPAGTGNGVQNWLIGRNDSGPGGAETLALGGIPINVRLHLFIDSHLSNNSNGSSGPYTLSIKDVAIVSGPPARRNSDFDGDGKADPSVYRPSTGVWYLNRSTAGPAGVVWGNANDKIAPEDFDGDGKEDIAVFRPSDGRWHILHSSTSTLDGRDWGAAGDIPATGDFTGDALAEVSVFRPSTGTWYYTCGDGCYYTQQFAINDIPVAGDYDGDGFTDLSVFRPSIGLWIITRSSLNGSQSGYQFGVASDKVVPADYDGDGKTDIAVYRPTEGRWYIANSGGSPAHTTHQFGIATDIPVPADYDGDGRADIAIFRPSDGNWWINRTTAGLVVIQWGQNGDKPTPNAFGN